MTKAPTKIGRERARGRFEPGNPGGPGRPAGSRNKATVVFDQLAEGEGAAVLQAVLASAKGGDMAAARIILDRVWPAKKSRAVSLPLPMIVTAADVLRAMGAVADAVAAGQITPDEGAAVAGILETKRRTIEAVDLEQRLAALEAVRQ